MCVKWNGGGCLFSVTVRRVEGERKRESVCVCERESVCVRERERERVLNISLITRKKLSVIFGCYWCFFAWY